MTVAELIKILQAMPQDAPIIYDCCSDYAEMDEDDVTLIHADEQKVIWREENGYMIYNPEWFIPEAERLAYAEAQVAEANKMIPRDPPLYKARDYLPSSKYAAEQPKFVTVCHFPGN